MNYEFNEGDYVEDIDGRIGYIDYICDCEECQKRGFNEPKIHYSDGEEDYITIYQLNNLENNFRRIGKYDFTKVKRVCIDRSDFYIYKSTHIDKNDDDTYKITNIMVSSKGSEVVIEYPRVNISLDHSFNIMDYDGLNGIFPFPVFEKVEVLCDKDDRELVNMQIIEK